MLVLALAACSSDTKTLDPGSSATTGSDTSTTTGGEDTGGPTGGETGDATGDTGDTGDTGSEPTFASITFKVDDSANKSYSAADGLAWKGSFRYDADENMLEFDGSWTGPFPMLWDDGPIGEGGHEAEGEQAGDSVWSIQVSIESPEADQQFEYGVISGSQSGSDGQWIFATDQNGTFLLPGGADSVVAAEGYVIDGWGFVDMRTSLELSKLDPTFAVDIELIQLKGSTWAWNLVTVDDPDGDGVYHFVLSEHIGTGPLAHAGLLSPGDEPEFVFEINTIEYKVAGIPPGPEGGVNAALWIDGAWVDQEITYNDKNNTVVVVPADLEPPDEPTGFEPPTNSIAVSFELDDSANQTYDATDGLAWKGAFVVNAADRTLTPNVDWDGPFAMLYDDGPWDEGGHEPAGSAAGDHRWGTTLWLPIPTEPITLDYGAIRDSADGSDGTWIWNGEGNGSVLIAADDTDVVAPGMTIAGFGLVDLRVELDVAAANASGWAGDVSSVQIKGSTTGWETPVPLLDDGLAGDTAASDGIYTFVLSNSLGKHDGKLAEGDQPAWVWVINGSDYTFTGVAGTDGVTAFSDAGAPGTGACLTPTADCAAETITLQDNGLGGQNTSVIVGAF